MKGQTGLTTDCAVTILPFTSQSFAHKSTLKFVGQP